MLAFTHLPSGIEFAWVESASNRDFEGHALEEDGAGFTRNISVGICREGTGCREQ